VSQGPKYDLPLLTSSLVSLLTHPLMPTLLISTLSHSCLTYPLVSHISLPYPSTLFFFSPHLPLPLFHHPLITTFPSLTYIPLFSPLPISLLDFDCTSGLVYVFDNYTQIYNFHYKHKPTKMPNYLPQW